MNGALFVQLTFDPDSVSLGDPKIRLDQEAFFREVSHSAGSGLRAQRHHTLAFHGNSELTTLVLHLVSPKASTVSLA
jgi:hypothetical protein